MSLNWQQGPSNLTAEQNLRLQQRAADSFFQISFAKAKQKLAIILLSYYCICLSARSAIKKNKLHAHHFGRPLAFISAIRAANYNMSFIKRPASSDEAKHGLLVRWQATSSSSWWVLSDDWAELMAQAMFVFYSTIQPRLMLWLTLHCPHDQARPQQATLTTRQNSTRWFNEYLKVALFESSCSLNSEKPPKLWNGLVNVHSSVPLAHCVALDPSPWSGVSHRRL